MSEVILSFCIPVMSRLGDLQSTLQQNLEDNLGQKGRVEFVVVSFDRHSETESWIQKTFPDDLASGYLSYHRSDLLSRWHFGRAKNAFRRLARGRIYASLDADNFTGPEGGQHIIDVFEANDYNCIFHQFQGDWGDGTCGRVAMTMQDYNKIGYDGSFLPRQWDELDAILSTIVQNPSRKYVCYEGKSIVEKSGPFRRFIEENDIPLQTVEVPVHRDPLYQARSGAAVGQQDSSYVQDDDRLRLSSVFNHLSSFFKNTKDERLRNQYVSELVGVQRSMAECLDPCLLLEWFLIPKSVDAPEIGVSDIILISCIRNEINLEDWLDHYQSLGVSHFLLVDDESNTPISERIISENVWVWEPVCGKFRYSKAFWLELLLRRYGDGNWVVIVDSDEYLELPDKMIAGEVETYQGAVANLQQLLSWAEAENISYFAGFLLDMVPGAEQLSKVQEDQPLGMEDFSRYQFRPIQAKPPYLEHHTVKWSYGDSAEWAYRIDIRFRLNRAFESLRKFPVFKMSSDIHLNQGFHDLLIAGEKRAASEMKRSDLLVIRHYNLLGAYHNTTGSVLRPVDAYHHETKINMERLQSHLKKALEIAAMSPFTYQYINPQLVPVPGCDRITIRSIDVEKTEKSYRDVLNRTREIPLIISNTNPLFQNGLLKARSTEEAALWCIRTTPFNEIVELNDSHAVLCVAGGLEANDYKCESKDLSESWLSGGFA